MAYNKRGSGSAPSVFRSSLLRYAPQSSDTRKTLAAIAREVEK